MITPEMMLATTLSPATPRAFSSCAASPPK